MSSYMGVWEEDSRAWRQNDNFDVLAAKRFDVNVIDRSRTEHILIKNVVISAQFW